MKALTALAAALFAAISLLLISAPASATAPGENGRIAYRLFLNEAQTRAASLTIRANGSHRHWVTHPGRRVLHLTPDWSPDARWIAYVRARAGDVTRRTRPHIFRLHPNGSGRKDLSTTCRRRCRINDDPAWSPNGRRIAFTRVFGDDLEEVDLMVMRADGTNVRHITNHRRFTRNEDWAPQWAPNGKRLVFHRVDKRRGHEAIFTIRLDGSGLRRLTRWGIDAHGEPDWSPNGRWINYEGSRGPCLVHPNGEARHCLFSNGGDFQWGLGSFSPDGTKIVVPRAPGVGPPSHYDVFRINIDGTGLFNVTQTAAWDGTPDWGPRRH